MCGLGARKAKFESLHIDPTAAKRHALGFEAKSLFDGGIAAQLDLAARAHHPLPRQSERTMQGSRDLPGRARKSRGPGYSSIGRNSAARNPLDGRYDFLMHELFATAAWIFSV
jgi:hypothetical protein